MSHALLLHRVDSYISGEVIARLRQDQLRLRETLEALLQSARKSGAARLAVQIDQLTALYLAHERLVGALLEAVEPDSPTWADIEE